MSKQILGKVGMLLKGEYSSSITYQKLDVVTYNGETYVAKTETQGNLPTNTGYWQLVASKGQTPQKGVDYYTNADKAEIEADVTNTVSSMIPDVSNFITASVNNLVNYYLKSETYNKTEVNNLISAMKTGIFSIVSTLPTPSIDTLNTIYLVPSADPKTQNIKDEYITITVGNGYDWEKIGSTAIDLSGYATETWVNTQISDFLTETEIQQLINTAISTKYTKPTLGIPKTDLASDVQASLTKADNSILVTETVSGTTPSIEAENNHLYICGEVETLSFTPSATGICNVIFTSGATATVLTLPQTVNMPEWFIVQPNTTYEISILNGVYGAVMLWS